MEFHFPPHDRYFLGSPRALRFLPRDTDGRLPTLIGQTTVFRSSLANQLVCGLHRYSTSSPASVTSLTECCAAQLFASLRLSQLPSVLRRLQVRPGGAADQQTWSCASLLLRFRTLLHANIAEVTQHGAPLLHDLLPFIDRFPREAASPPSAPSARAEAGEVVHRLYRRVRVLRRRLERAAKLREQAAPLSLEELKVVASRLEMQVRAKEACEAERAGETCAPHAESENAVRAASRSFPGATGGSDSVE